RCRSLRDRRQKSVVKSKDPPQAVTFLPGLIAANYRSCGRGVHAPATWDVIHHSLRAPGWRPTFRSHLPDHLPRLKFSVSEIALITTTIARLSQQAGLFRLLQLRVLRLGLLQDGDVGVGVFPEGEEIFVGGERPDAGGVGIGSLRGSRLQRVRACHAQMRQRSRPAVPDDAAVVENLLKLGSGGTTLSRCQV